MAIPIPAPGVLRSCPALLAAVLAFALAPAVAAPPARENARIERILAQRAEIAPVDRVALSPDGLQVAYLVEQDGHGRLELADWPMRNVRTVQLAGACQPEDIAWAPDAQTLAVLTRCPVDPSNTRPMASAIEVLDARSGRQARVVAQLQGFAQSLAWSADGRRLDFLYVPGATRLPWATAAANPRVGVIGGNNVQVQRVASVARAGGPPTLLTPAQLYVYEFAESADGKQLAYTAAQPPGDDNWWTARLYAQDARAGAAPRLLVDPGSIAGSLHGLQMALPRWSPDGRQILFIGGLMSDRGSSGGDLYAEASAGGAPRNLTPGVTVTPAWFAFTGARSLLVSQIAAGHVQLAEYVWTGNLARQSRTWFTAAGSVDAGDASLSVAMSSAAPRRIAYAGESFEQPPEVHAGTLGNTEPAAVTTLNARLTHDWGRAESLTWKNGGQRVQGWLLYPLHYDASRQYPLVVYVHGGPSSATLPGWGTRPTALSEFGYFVLLPNPRGSFGEGEAYAQAIRQQMGYGDLDDILAGVDAVEKKLPVDDARLGMMGWSYGGFMTMFAPTRTQRFKAVVSGAGIADWQSYYGQNQIDQWMIPFFGASLYDDPPAYAKSSAINFIKRARTPALIVVGERDEECPAAQSFEYWHALHTLGVPTTLVVYANEGHHIAQSRNQQDILQRALDWFGKYLAPVAAR